MDIFRAVKKSAIFRVGSNSHRFICFVNGKLRTFQTHETDIDSCIAALFGSLNALGGSLFTPQAMTRLALAGLLATAPFALTPQAHALPTGYESVHGDVEFHQPDTNTLNITTSNPNAIVNFQSYNILHGETVNYFLPGSTSSILNQILGGGPSQILGIINSNGQVFLVNPAGIHIGSTAQINAAGLVASTLVISNHDFLNGNLVFRNNGTAGSVINQGNIGIEPGGFAILLGSSIENGGSIIAPNGQVALAVGNKVTLDVDHNLSVKVSVDEALVSNVQDVADAILNTGTLQADGGLVQLQAKLNNSLYERAVNNEGVVKALGVNFDDNGVVEFVGVGGVVRNTNLVDASGLEGGTIRIEGDKVLNSGDLLATGSAGLGGDIRVLGDDVTLLADATLDASGNLGGGQILVGGGYQGGNGIRRAQFTEVQQNVLLDASGNNAGDGGQVVAWSDVYTWFFGLADVSSGENGGRGGLIEISSAGGMNFDGSVNARGVLGGGRVLFDPANITILDTDTSTGTQDGLYTRNIAYTTNANDHWRITRGKLESLVNGADVTLQAKDNIYLRDLGGDETLNMQLGAGYTFTLEADADKNGVGGFYMLDLNDTIKTNGGNVNILGNRVFVGNINSKGGDITLTSVNGTGGYVFAGDLDAVQGANAGRITLTGPDVYIREGKLVEGERLTVSGGDFKSATGTISASINNGNGRVDSVTVSTTEKTSSIATKLAELKLTNLTSANKIENTGNLSVKQSSVTNGLNLKNTGTVTVDGNVTSSGGTVQIQSSGNVTLNKKITGAAITIDTATLGTNASITDSSDGQTRLDTAGDLTLLADGTIGAMDNPLNIEVGGKVDATSNQSTLINLEANGTSRDLTVGLIQVFTHGSLVRLKANNNLNIVDNDTNAYDGTLNILADNGTVRLQTDTGNIGGGTGGKLDMYATNIEAITNTGSVDLRLTGSLAYSNLLTIGGENAHFVDIATFRNLYLYSSVTGKKVAISTPGFLDLRSGSSIQATGSGNVNQPANTGWVDLDAWMLYNWNGPNYATISGTNGVDIDVTGTINNTGIITSGGVTDLKFGYLNNYPQALIESTGTGAGDGIKLEGPFYNQAGRISSAGSIDIYTASNAVNDYASSIVAAGPITITAPGATFINWGRIQSTGTGGVGNVVYNDTTNLLPGGPITLGGSGTAGSVTFNGGSLQNNGYYSRIIADGTGGNIEIVYENGNLDLSGRTINALGGNPGIILVNGDSMHDGIHYIANGGTGGGGVTLRTLNGHDITSLTADVNIDASTLTIDSDGLFNLAGNFNGAAITAKANGIGLLTERTGDLNIASYSSAGAFLASMLGNVNLNGDVTVGGGVFVGAKQNVNLNNSTLLSNAGTDGIVLATQSGGVVDIDASSQVSGANVAIEADDLILNGLLSATGSGGNGNLTLNTATAGRTFNLGSNLATVEAGFSVDNGELSRMSAQRLNIGNAEGTAGKVGNIRLGTGDYSGLGQLTLNTTGSITDNTTAETANITLADGRNLIITGGANTGAGAVGGAGDADIDIALSGNGALRLKTNNADANIDSPNALNVISADTGTGALSLAADGNLNLNGNASGGPVNLDSGMDVTVASGVTVSGSSIVIDADGNITNSGTLSAITLADLNAGTGISGNGPIIAATVDLSSTTGDIGANNTAERIRTQADTLIVNGGGAAFVRNTGDLNLQNSTMGRALNVRTVAGNGEQGHLTVTGPLASTDGNVVLRAEGNVAINSGVTVQADINRSGGNNTGNITVNGVIVENKGTLTAGRGVTFNADDDVNNEGTILAGGHVAFNAVDEINNRTKGKVTGASVTFDTDDDINNAGAVTATVGDVNFVSRDSIANTTGMVIAQGNVLFEAVTDARNINGGSITANTGKVTLDAGNDVLNTGTVTATLGDVEFLAGDSINNEGGVTAGGNISFDARGGRNDGDHNDVRNSGNVHAGGNVVFLSNDDIVTRGRVTADNGDVTFTAQDDIRVFDTVSGRNIRLTASNGNPGSHADIYLAGDLNADTTSGVVNLTADNDILQESTPAVLVTGHTLNLNAGGQVQANSPFKIDVDELSVNARRADILNQGDLTLLDSSVTNRFKLETVAQSPGEKGSLTITGQVDAGRVDFDAAHNLINEGSISTRNNLDLHAGNNLRNRNTGYLYSRNGDILLDAAQDVIINGNLRGKAAHVQADRGDITVTAGNDIRVNGSMLAGKGNVSLTAEDAFNNAGRIHADNTLQVQAKSLNGKDGDHDDVVNTGFLTANGAVSISSGDAIDNSGTVQSYNDALALLAVNEITNDGTLQADQLLVALAGGNITNRSLIASDNNHLILTTSATIDNNGGANISARRWSLLAAGGDINNDGGIDSRNLLMLSGGSIDNTGTATATRRLLFLAGNDIDNSGMVNGRQLVFMAGNDILNSGTVNGRQLVFMAGNDIDNSGTVQSFGRRGSISFLAADDILNRAGGNITARGDITMVAGQSRTRGNAHNLINNGNITSTGGDVSLAAWNNIRGNGLTMGDTVTLLAQRGSIGRPHPSGGTNRYFRTAANNLQADAANGSVYVLESDNVNVLASLAEQNWFLQLANPGDITVSGRVQARDVRMTTVGSHINVNADIEGFDHVLLSAALNGNISGPGLISGELVELLGVNGQIDVNTNATNLSANTGGNRVFINETNSVNLLNSSSGGTFSLLTGTGAPGIYDPNGNGTVYLNQVSGSNVNITAAGSILDGNGGAVNLIANGTSRLVANGGIIGSYPDPLEVLVRGGDLWVGARGAQGGFSVVINGVVDPSDTLRLLWKPPGAVLFNGRYLGGGGAIDELLNQGIPALVYAYNYETGAYKLLTGNSDIINDDSLKNTIAEIINNMGEPQPFDLRLQEESGEDGQPVMLLLLGH